mmetsp:Transcript_55429/g.63335  ORF Transcript_55429/g.63335 Transcript_55429/m.63335 type:complete len:390 (+) Transcript_55429:40-1209(+)
MGCIQSRYCVQSGGNGLNQSDKEIKLYPIKLKEQSNATTAPDNTAYYTTTDDHKLHTWNDVVKLRVGKSLQQCVEEFNGVLNKLAKLNFTDQKEQKAGEAKSSKSDLIEIKLLEKWKRDVYIPICQSTGEVRNFAQLSCDAKMLKISHEVQGWKDFALIKNFCDSISLNVDPTYFSILEASLQTLCALTYKIYIKFYYNHPSMVVDIGVSGVKPLERKTLDKVFVDSREGRNIAGWADIQQNPIPTEMSFSFTDQKHSKTCVFYIFDCEEKQNLAKALSAFEYYNISPPPNITRVLSKIKSDEITVLFQFNDTDGVETLSIQLQKMTIDQEEELMDNIDNQKYTEKWEEFKNLFLGEDADFFLELTYEGYKINLSCEAGEPLEATLSFL